MNGLSPFPDFKKIPNKTDTAIIANGRFLLELFSYTALAYIIYKDQRMKAKLRSKMVLYFRRLTPKPLWPHF